MQNFPVPIKTDPSLIRYSLGGGPLSGIPNNMVTWWMLKILMMQLIIFKPTVHMVFSKLFYHIEITGTRHVNNCQGFS